MTKKIQLYLRQYKNLYGKDLYVNKDKSNHNKNEHLNELITWIIKEEKMIDDFKINNLNKYFSSIKDCMKFDLKDSSDNFIFGMGNPHSDIVFIDQYQMEKNGLKNLSFIGKTGQLLDKILGAINLNRDDIYILNILKCKIVDKIDLSIDEINLYNDLIIKQLEMLNPKLIVSLGKSSAITLLQNHNKLSDLRTKIHKFQNIDFLVTYHPSILFKNPNLKKFVWEDFKLIRDKYLA